jgi:hypothetical protein
MQIATSLPGARCPSWVLAFVALFAMPSIGRDPQDPTTSRAVATVDARPPLEARPLRQSEACHDAESRAACLEIEHFVSTAEHTDAPAKLWDAYDRLALAHLSAFGDRDVETWLTTVQPSGSALGARLGPNEVVVVWSDPTYLSGARASRFARDKTGRWNVIAHRTLDLAGQHVSLEWSRNGVLLIAGMLRGGDAEWLSLVELDARHARFAVTPVVTDIYLDGERQAADGVVIDTLVQPKHFITHLFDNWRQQEVTIAWTGQRFRKTTREVEPVVATLERYCAGRSTCARATLQEIEYVSEYRARADFSGMSNDCEYGKPYVTIELAKTDRWRVVSLACSPEPASDSER